MEQERTLTQLLGYIGTWSATEALRRASGQDPVERLAEAVRGVAREHSTMLLANHGPIVSAKSLEDAVYNSEELEETAKLFFLIGERPARPLTCEAVEELNRVFPS